jgi:hypothetical protein
MLQSYHAMPISPVVHEVADDERGFENEGSALLGSSASRVGLTKSEEQKEGPASLTSSVGNLANTIIGGGESCHMLLNPLSFPYRIMSSHSSLVPYLCA